MSSCDKLTEQMSPISLAIWAQHQTTAATEFVCFLPLCHSHWGARQGGELNSLCSFCPVFCKASDICPSSRQPQGSSRKRYVVIRSKGQDGILWMCQYVVNMETDFTSKTGMACPAHVVLEFLQCRVRAEASLAFLPQRQLRVHAWNAVYRQTSFHFPSIKIEIMLSSLLFWRPIHVILQQDKGI